MFRGQLSHNSTSFLIMQEVFENFLKKLRVSANICWTAKKEKQKDEIEQVKAEWLHTNRTERRLHPF